MIQQTHSDSSDLSIIDLLCPFCEELICICPRSPYLTSGFPTMASDTVPPVTGQANTPVQVQEAPSQPTEYSASQYSQGTEEQAATTSDQAASTQAHVTFAPIQGTSTPVQAASTPVQISVTPSQPAVSTPVQAVSTSVQAASTPVQDPVTPTQPTASTPPSDAEVTPPVSNRTTSTTPEHTEKTPEEADADVLTRRAVVTHANFALMRSQMRAGKADTTLAQSNAHLQTLQSLTITYLEDAQKEPDANPEENPALIAARAKVTRQEEVVKTNRADVAAAHSQCRTDELAAAHAEMHLAKARHTAAWIRRNIASARYDRLLQTHVDPENTHANIHNELKARERAASVGGGQPTPQDKEKRNKKKAFLRRRASRFFGSLMSSRKNRGEPSEGGDQSQSGRGDQLQSGTGEQSQSGTGDQSQSGRGDQSQSGGGDQSSSRRSTEQGRTKRPVREVVRALFTS